MRSHKLKWHLPDQLAGLKRLVIRDCRQPMASAPLALKIHELELEDYGKLQFDYHLTFLKGLTIRRHNMDASLLKTIGQIVSDTSLDFLHTYFSSNMNISMSHCYDFLLTLTINGGCDSNNFSARFVSKTPFA